MKTGQVFVSHTSDMAEFPESRTFAQAAIDAVGRAGMAAVDMRHFPAQDGSPADYCRKRVRECEIYVAVVGFRYGSIVPGAGVSYTELEFQTASLVGIPRLVFLLEDAACPPGISDGDRGLIENFRQRLLDAGLVVRAFTSGDGLELEIFHALSKLTSNGSAPESQATFAGLLRHLRAKVGLTSQELAKRARLSLPSVDELEQGRAVIDQQKTASRLADALKLTGAARTTFEAAAAERDLPSVSPLTSAQTGRSHVPATLAQMPEEFPSNPPRVSTTVPRIWYAPNRNADFTGRDAILTRLHSELAGDGRAVVLARAVYGLGGVGKTQVALEYAHRFKSDYDLIWWIDAEQPQEISSTLAELASRLGLRTSDTVAEAAAAALEQLRCDVTGRWLLIFDNAEDPADLEPFLPAGPGHVIITSRNQAWSRHAEPLELDVFSPHESARHLQRHVPGLNGDDAARVSEAVGNLPLAIEQAAAWLAETGMPAALYAEWLETQATRALGLNKPLDYAKPVVAAWNLSLNRLREGSPASVRFLQILAFCSPGPISMTLLYSDAMIERLLPFDETLSKLTLGRVIGDISRFALVKVDQGSNSLQIHRLVQAVIRSQMTDAEQAGARHEVHKILAGARPQQGETDDPANWSTYDIIWPHLGPSVAEECNDPRTRQLLIDWVRYQWKQSEFDSGLALARRLESLWSGKLGPDHQQTLHLQFHIANLLRSQGRFGEARDLDTYVLERQREVLGPHHPHSLITANGLAADLRALGDFQESLALDQATYESSEEQFGGDYQRTLTAAHNLGCALRLVGDCFTARRLDEETLDRQRRVHGHGHPHTLLSLASLALDLRAAGAFQESVDLLQQTWAMYRELLGEDMSETLLTAASLAVSLRKAGEQEKAMNLDQDIYARYERRYGNSAPDTLSCALNLACDYAATGDMPQALDLVTRVHAAYQAGLGDDHPNTLVAANNQGSYLRCAGRAPEALALTADTLERMRRKLGESHPLTLSCAVNLANCRADSGDAGSAETLERKTIILLGEVLRRDHPDTLVCQANLSVTLRQAGRDREAGELRARIMPEFDRILGADHPDSRQLLQWQRINRDLEALRI